MEVRREYSELRALFGWIGAEASPQLPFTAPPHVHKTGAARVYYG